MTKEGRLMRGKENYEKKRFLDNSETLEYIYMLPENVAKRKAEAEAKKKAEATKSKGNQ